MSNQETFWEICKVVEAFKQEVVMKSAIIFSSVNSDTVDAFFSQIQGLLNDRDLTEKESID